MAFVRDLLFEEKKRVNPRRNLDFLLENSDAVLSMKRFIRHLNEIRDDITKEEQ